MKVKAFVMMVIVVNILAAPNTAFAEEKISDAEKVIEVVEYGIADDMEMLGYASEVNDVVPRGSSRPSISHNLAERYYVLNFPNVTDYTYSLVYFKPDSLGRVSIYTNSITSGGERIMIRLYKRNGHECVSTWYGNPQSLRGLGYSNLQATENYYFRFDVFEASSINGTGYIHHPDNPIPVD